MNMSQYVPTELRKDIGLLLHGNGQEAEWEISLFKRIRNLNAFVSYSKPLVIRSKNRHPEQII